MTCDIWDQIITELRTMEARGAKPVAVVMTEEHWDLLRQEWRFGFRSGPEKAGQRRLNGLPVALADADYEGPAVVGVWP